MIKVKANVKSEEIPLAERWQRIKDERNYLLKETDWCMLSDSSQNTGVMIEYRQKLRDIPQAFKTPEEVKFPVNPLEKD